MNREALAAALSQPALNPGLADIRARVSRQALRYPVINPGEVAQNEEVARDAQSAAVLILLTPEKHGLGVVLTRRTEHLRHHPGQISFPGGRQTATDRDCIATALRETEEEIGLSASSGIEVLGSLGDYYTVTGFRVRPVLACSSRPHAKLRLVRDPGEVAAILNVPLRHLLDPANYCLQASRYAGYLRHYYETVWDEQRIWGATAGIMMGLYHELAD